MPSLLGALRCIQLDPLDPIGTNADLVCMARMDGVTRGQVYRDLLPGHAFEHFAKERCLIPASGFPYYRDQAVETPWWRLTERLQRLPSGIAEAVLAEVAARGPITAKELTDHGAVDAIDWHGWKGTGKATSMALRVLWTQCRVVVCGRTLGGKQYDIPERALPKFAGAPAGDFSRWAVLERTEASGLLSRNDGPWWSMLFDVRKSALPDALVAEGAVEEIVIEGTKRRYLAPRGFRERSFPECDDRMRILGPLDPAIWDRKLVKHLWGFDYVWEVYKPPAKRQYGWYVCPLLHRGRLVGRLEARLREGVLVVENLWREPDEVFDEAAFRRCIERHATGLGAVDIRYTQG